MLLDPVKDDSGNFVDSAGNQATSFFVNLLGDTGYDYTLLFGSNSDYEFSTNIYFSRFNVVCQKAPEVSGELNFEVLVPYFEKDCLEP